MWVVRELARLLLRITVTVAVASLIAGLRVWVSGGSMLHTWRITLLVLAVILLVFAFMGRSGLNLGQPRIAQLQRVDGPGGILQVELLKPRPEDPTLTATAVFFFSALALVAIALTT